MTTIYFTKTAYNALIALAGLPPEAGGALGGRIIDGILTVTDVWFDHRAGSGCKSYIPVGENLEAASAGWYREGKEILGVLHSHPPLSVPYLSKSDLYAGRCILEANKMDRLVLGILWNGQPSLYLMERATNYPIPLDIYII